VKAIAARLADGYWGECAGCAVEEANADVRALLQERARLLAVVEAARKLYTPEIRIFLKGETDAYGRGEGDEFELGEEQLFEARRELKQALAALDALAARGGE